MYECKDSVNTLSIVDDDFTDEHADIIVSDKKYTALFCDSCYIDTEEVKVLAESLQVSNIANDLDGIKALAEVLPDMKKIADLNICETDICAAGIQCIISKLSLTKMKLLDLINSNIDLKGENKCNSQRE